MAMLRPRPLALAPVMSPEAGHGPRKPAAAPDPGSRWRPTPPRLLALLAGLALFGAGEACLVASALGASPWAVFAQGLAHQLPITVGTATVATSFAILLLWIPLRERPGLGTILNAIVIGTTMDAVLDLLPNRAALPVRAGEVIAGIALIGVGSGIYLCTRMGPGPRDGLMTGLHRITGRPIAPIRAGIELTALAVGVALGGRLGIGTVAFALLIGPAVALALRVFGALGQPQGQSG